MAYVWRRDDSEYVEFDTIEGERLERPAGVRVLAESDRMLLLEVTMTGDSPPHVHSHDSVGYVVSGRVRMTVGDSVSELGPGDSFFHPPGTTHQMVALDNPSVWLEVKSPPARPWQQG